MKKILLLMALFVLLNISCKKNSHKTTKPASQSYATTQNIPDSLIRPRNDVLTQGHLPKNSNDSSKTAKNPSK